MRTSQVTSLIIVAGIICLGIGLGAGSVIYSGKITTTSILQTSTIIETQTTTAIEKVNVTVPSYCCVDSNLTSSTPCTTIEFGDYPPTQRLEYVIETDPRYIFAEQDHNYSSLYSLSCGSGYVLGSGDFSQVQFQSAYAIDRLYTDGCGQVENFTYFVTVTVPLTETGYNMSAIQISSSNIADTTPDCSSSIVSTVNTTVTITGTTST